MPTMRLFVSAGEPSGDMHGANLVRALRGLCPDVACAGFGGERLAAAGCPLVYPLADDAVIGVLRVLGSVNHFRRVLALADQHFRTHRPDAVVLIDFPGFHWWLARRARAHGIPVVYFVPPQLWAWGAWRVGKMRRLVDHVLCGLPFEASWYRERGIPAHYIGHPYFDELPRQRLDGAFLADQRARPGPVVALLPGSRRQELENNPATLLRTAALVHARRPDARFLVACLREEHRGRVQALLGDSRLPLEVHAGRTPEILELAHCAVAVSGSVGLELLYRGKPSVVLYRVNGWGMLAAWALMRCRYMSLVNLLAGKELYPEFLTRRCEAEAMAGHVLRWLEDRPAYDALCGELAALRGRVAEPGACERAARFVLDAAGGRAARAA
jgi:lipid-A-disaccharide synthase